MAIGAERDVTFNVGTLPAGSHTILVRADPNNQIDELNESNNTSEETFIVTQAPQPDLVVSALTFDPSSPNTDQSVTALFTLANIGNATSGSFEWQILVGGTIVTAQTTPGMAAQTERDLTFDLGTLPVGSHTVEVRVDPDKQIDEANESNNARETTLIVTQPTLADLVVSSLSFTPAELSDVDSSEYRVTMMTPEHAGDYTLDVTNTIVPGLTLASAALRVVAQPGVGSMIEVTEPDSTEVMSGDPILIEAVLPDEFEPDDGELCYRRTGQTVYECVPLEMSGETNAASIPGNFVTERGIDYFLRFRRGVSVITTPEVQAESVPFRLSVSVSEFEAAGLFTPSTYRMISVPLRLEDPSIDAVLDGLGPYNPRNWRLLRWNPGRNDYDEVPDISATFTTCTAFWLITRAGTGFTAGAGTSVDPVNPCDATLAPGWNQIANPYAFPIARETVDVPSGVESPVEYDATVIGEDPYDYEPSVLAPWSGYWVNNTNSEPVVLAFIPVDASTDAAKTAQAAKTFGASQSKSFLNEASFTVQLIATMSPRNLKDAHNYAGISEGASAHCDAMDFAEAPGIGTHVRLSLIQNGRRLAGNFKDPLPDGQEWEFEISAAIPNGLSPEGEVVSVSVREHGVRPSGHEIFVFDVDLGKRLLLIGGSFEVTLTESLPVRNLKLIVGTRSFALDHSGPAGLAPATASLGQTYPNPFAASTRIAYQLKETSHVEIAVYDALGRRVRKLVDSIHEIGWYEVAWDGQDEGGHRLAAGLYPM